MDDLDAVGPDMREQRYIESRVYANVTERYDRERFDVRSYHVKWTKTGRYRLGRKVGQGHFGEAFEALDTESNRRVVVKTLKAEHRAKSKLKKEIKMLEYIRGGPNIVRLLDTVKDRESGRKLLVFEKVDYVKARDLFPDLSNYDVCFYAYQILRALDYTHSKGVMHRDVKPSNILIDPARRVARLIDWGVAGFYFPREKNVRGPGTRCYKSPELSLRYDYYDYSVDMWAFGCTFGSMMFLEHPMVRGKGSWFNQLLATVQITGSNDLFALMRKLHITLSDEQTAALSGHPKRAWDSWVNDSNRSRVSPEALDLISHLMLADHTKRFTAREAMEHGYFDAVRDDAERGGESGSYEYVEESCYVYDSSDDE
eukprot:c48097_g1_i1.p1 GENE.c48097_g1_i1~~c48097_g1_i1.p1  ORF type:complete len:397 (-),score=71.25 c48097_g1_i1:151-1260(-)